MKEQKEERPPQAQKWREIFLDPILKAKENKRSLPENAIVTRQQFAAILGLQPARISEAQSYLDHKKEAPKKSSEQWEKFFDELLKRSEEVVASELINWENDVWVLNKNIASPAQKNRPAPHTFDSLPANDIIASFNEAKAGDTIRILDTWIPTFIFQDIDNVAKVWLEDWAEKGVSFEILVLDPVGAALKMRVKAIKQDWLAFRQITVSRLETLLKSRGRYPKQIMLRFYDEAPSVNVFITPKQIYFGTYFSFAPSTNTSFQRIENDNSNTMAAHLNKHFETIWSRAETLESSNFERIRKDIRAVEVISQKLRNSHIQIHLPTDTIPNTLSQRLLFSKDFAGRNTNLGGTVELNFEMDDTVGDSEKAHWILKGSDNMINGKVFIIHENYFRLQFATDQKELTLNFVIQSNIEENKPIWAIYSAIHNKRAYCGIAIARFYTDKTQPFTVSAVSDTMALHSRSFWHPAFISESASEKSSIQPYKGLYYVHTYGRDNKNREDIIIVSNLLEIYESGYVEYCRRGTEVQATGHAFLCEGNIYVELFTKDKRQSYFIFYAGSHTAKAGRFYTGVYSGLSQNHDNPIALRAVLEYKKENGENANLFPLRNKIYSKGYEALPEGIRIALTGRIDNFISFPRLNGAIFSDDNLRAEVLSHHEYDGFKDIYVKAAIVSIAYNDDWRKGLKHLERAYRHGYSDFSAFERMLKSIDEYIHNAEPDSLDAHLYIMYKKIADRPEYLKLKAKHEEMLREKARLDEDLI
jgi:hypothetical protein